MPDTHTPRWHMERNLDFVATFLHFSSFFSTMLKSEENEEKWRKRKKSKGNEEKWIKWTKNNKSEANEEKWRKWRKTRNIKKSEENEEKWKH